jgi:hypothetical protein
VRDPPPGQPAQVAWNPRAPRPGLWPGEREPVGLDAEPVAGRLEHRLLRRPQRQRMVEPVSLGEPLVLGELVRVHRAGAEGAQVGHWHHPFDVHPYLLAVGDRDQHRPGRVAEAEPEAAVSGRPRLAARPPWQLAVSERDAVAREQPAQQDRPGDVAVAVDRAAQPGGAPRLRWRQLPGRGGQAGQAVERGVPDMHLVRGRDLDPEVHPETRPEAR